MSMGIGESVQHKYHIAVFTYAVTHTYIYTYFYIHINNICTNTVPLAPCLSAPCPPPLLWEMGQAGQAWQAGQVWQFGGAGSVGQSR